MLTFRSNSGNDASSLWADISPPRAPAPALAQDCDIDICIIGGGYTGLSTALHLARRGRKVMLLEGWAIGWGGSGRNSGHVVPVLAGSEPDALETHYGEAGERLVRLMRDSAAFLFDLVRHEGIDCEAEQSGWLQPAHRSDRLQVCEKRAEAWAKRGAPCEMLDKAAMAARLGSDCWFGGLHNPTGGHINPLMLARGLARVCESAGVTIHEATAVTTIARHASRWQVRTASGAVTCDQVLLATNAYSNELASNLAPKIARSIIPVTSWHMCTAPIAAGLRQKIMPGREAVGDTSGDLQFFRYDARNRLISGGALVSPLNARTRIQALVKDRIQRVFPALGRPEFSHVWSGYIGITPDHFPHFHQPGPGYWAAIGYNGRGVALSLSIGRELARAINGDDMRDLALPLSAPKKIPFHAMARRVGRGALAYYRWRDGHKPKI